jgi:hydrogenase-1 operon protein HyaF
MNHQTVGNVSALLAEILALLEKQLQTGQVAAIDLKGLPFSPGEYAQLKDFLGQGEVLAKLDAIGPSDIFETRYPGVWWLTHRNAEGDIVADVIEVTRCPDILKSQPEDMGAGLSRLRSVLSPDLRSD